MLGDMKLRVVGVTTIVTGTDRNTSSYKGKQTSGLHSFDSSVGERIGPNGTATDAT